MFLNGHGGFPVENDQYDLLSWIVHIYDIYDIYDIYGHVYILFTEFTGGEPIPETNQIWGHNFNVNRPMWEMRMSPVIGLIGDSLPLGLPLGDHH